VNIEDEQKLKDDISYAEYELSLVYEKYWQAENNLAEARRKLGEWNDGIQFKK
jgi:hypothetical protein